MAHNDSTPPTNLCHYAKIKYDQRVQLRLRNRSSSAPLPSSQHHLPSNPYTKLHKPPTLQALHSRPRNRLQKRTVTPPSSTLHLPTVLFILCYESYPYNIRPAHFLGAYSSLDAVTAAALRHGAYAFSREGIWDGSEYLSPEGRIRIVQRVVERGGVRASVPSRTRSLDNNAVGVVRLDIPHPNADTAAKKNTGETVYLAVHESRCAAECVGVFAEVEGAWGACLESKKKCAVRGAVVDEARYFVKGNMPKVVARVVGEGRHGWFVQECGVDGGER